MRGGAVQALTVVLAAATLTVGSPAVARAEPVLVYPGMEIHQDNHVCTLGYVDPGLRVAFTAGHCRGSGTVTNSVDEPIGVLATFRDNTPNGATVNTDQVIADYEAIVLADDVITNDVLPGGRRLEAGGPDATVTPGEPVCHFGIVTGETCGTVERVNNGWFTMGHGVLSQQGDSGGPVYVLRGDHAQIVGLFNSKWGDDPAAVSWPAISQQVREDVGIPAT